MALNALLKTKERHSHRQWILNWLEDNYECKKGATICKAAVFSDYGEVCRLQTLKPVTNSLFGKLVKAVFPTIRTCRKGPRSDSRTHYAGLHRRRETISLPRVCPETGELLPAEEGGSGMTSFIPAPSSSSGIVESIPLHSADCSLTSSTPSSPTISFEMSPVAGVVEASGSLPAFQFGQQLSDQFASTSFGLLQHQHHSDQLTAVSTQLSFYSPPPSLSSCSSGASTYDDALSEFEEMDLGDGSLPFGGEGGLDDSCFASQLPMPVAPQCLCPSCEGSSVDSNHDDDNSPADMSQHQSFDDHESSSLETVDDVLGDLEPRLLNLDPSMLHQITASTGDHDHHHPFGLGSSSDCCGYVHVPAVQMSSSMMAPPISPSPPASPPPPLALMTSSEFGQCHGAVHQHQRLRPFLRRTMAMAAAKTSAQAAEGNPLAEGLMGMINTCQKIIKDRTQKRRRKSIGDSLKQEPHNLVHPDPPHHHHHHPLHHHQQQQQQQQHAAKQEPAMVVVVDANALVPPFVLSPEEIPGGQHSFAVQESVLVFANEYRKMYQAVFDRLVRFEYAILFDLVFSFWNQVKLQPNFSFLLDHDAVKKQVIAYDRKVLHTFKDYFTMNPLKMSSQQFGGFLQTIAFHLPFSVERATLPLLPTDLFEEKMRLLQTFASDLQGQAQSFTLPQAPSLRQHQQQQQQQPQTIMEINNY